MKKYADSRWVNTIKIMSFAYQYGITGMVRAFVPDISGKSPLQWMLPHAQTIHLYKNKDQTNIPEQLEAIVPGLYLS